MTVVLEKQPVDTNRGNGFGCKVILFNDDVHSFDEVVNQIIKAIHCSARQAMGFAMEAHGSGSAIVFSGHFERCEHVATILEEIKLRVKVER